MAARTINITDTLETFRQQFNALSSQDFGDIASLSGAISSTNLVDAMNETIGIVTASSGFRIEDSSSTQQIIGGGDILKIFGTSNQLNAVVSSNDTLTLSLTNDVTIANDLNVTNDLDVTGNAIATTVKSNNFQPESGITSTFTGNWTVTGDTTLGTISVSGNTISSTDSTEININDSLQVTGTIKGNIESSLIQSASGSISFGSSNLQTGGYLYLGATSGGIIYEGTGVDNFELNLVAPTVTADRSVTIPDESGIIITTGAIDRITEAMMANDAISSAELKNVVTLVIYNSAGTPVKTLYGAGS